MIISKREGQLVIDGEAWLVITPSSSNSPALTVDKAVLSEPVTITDFYFLRAKGKTRIGRWWILAKACWKYTAVGKQK